MIFEDIVDFSQFFEGLCVTYLAAAGVVGWFGLFGANVRAELIDAPFYGKSKFVEDHLIYPMVSYQGWNLLLCFFNADLRDPAMIGHHLVTGSLAYFGLAPYLHYYGLFFFGVAELTNVPLTIVDVFKYFPDLAKKLSILNEISRISFAASFIILRLIVWPYFSYHFALGSINLLTTNFHTQCHSGFVVGFFLFANVFLTGLQFFWGSKIIGFLFKSGKKSSKEGGGAGADKKKTK